MIYLFNERYAYINYYQFKDAHPQIDMKGKGSPLLILRIYIFICLYYRTEG